MSAAEACPVTGPPSGAVAGAAESIGWELACVTVRSTGAELAAGADASFNVDAEGRHIAAGSWVDWKYRVGSGEAAAAEAAATEAEAPEAKPGVAPATVGDESGGVVPGSGAVCAAGAESLCPASVRPQA